jgi:Gas vesicle synthesis protein GvpO
MSKPLIAALEAVQLGPEYMAEISHRQPTRVTAVEPADEGRWIVEVEMIEDRRIPSSADMLALYEIELDAEGALLGYARTRRYMRGQTLVLVPDEQMTTNRDTSPPDDTA